MEIQTTKFVTGGYISLQDEVHAQKKIGKHLSTILFDDGDYFTVFLNKSIQLDHETEKLVTIVGTLFDLNEKVNKLAKDGWFVVTISENDESNYIICVAKEKSPTVSHEHELSNYIANYGND